jgi:hypothetical protein
MKTILTVIIIAKIAAVITVGTNSNYSCDNVDKTVKLGQMRIYILETK